MGETRRYALSPTVKARSTNNWQDAILVRTRLEELHDVQHRRPAIFKGSPFTIKMKAANERAQWQRMLNYEGPDTATLDFLHDFGEQWSRCPMTFWTHCSIAEWNVTDLQARLVMLYQ